jgi:hypothetical protein
MPKRKIGAPPKRDPRPGERFTIATRVRPELKRRLDAAAEESGRSQAQETELRLERSFDHGDLLGDTLSLAFGERLAGLLILLGIAMIDQGRRITDREGDWTSNSVAYDAAVFAAIRLLEFGRPDGSRASDSDHGVATKWVRELIEDLNDRQAANKVLGHWRTDAIIRLIGPIVTRMGEALKRDARGNRPSSRNMREVR